MNNVSLIGRPTKDPELRFTPTGIPYCFFTLAVDRDFKDKNGKREADFILIRVWNKLAQNTADYVTKGRLISVTGRIETDSYQAKDGSVKYKTGVIAENVRFLGPRKTGNEPQAGEEPAAEEGDFVNAEGEGVSLNISEVMPWTMNP